MESDKDQLKKIRHSLAHIMAQAVLDMRPSAKLGFGPDVDNGFYYDFDFGDEPITDGDLKQIEKRMQKIVKKRQEFTSSTKTLDESLAMLEETGQTYKAEYVKELAETGVELSFFENGPFVDLCEGPHLETTGQIEKGSFCLDKLAGSYWRGSEKNPMLTRIYGLAFETRDKLKEYKKLRELAKQRDHRKLGTELELFSLSEKVGGGLVLWHPKGSRIRNAIEDFWRKEHFKNGYELLYTPHVGLANLWETSGHLEFYKDTMYPQLTMDEREFYVKPMNCPFHIEIYQQRPHSYKELPLRWAELGTVYRYEQSGALNGLLRVRGFTQDDAHVICRPDQIEDEIAEVLSFCQRLLKAFGFSEFKAYLATKPAKAIGDDSRWEKALESLENAAKRLDLDCEIDEGGGAFYGPKIDLKIKDALGREWQCSTIQFDFNLPQEDRFDITYIGDDGEKHQPYVVHRALLGSIERFFALLVEHYGGAFPTWLAPTHVRLVPVGDHAFDYANEIAAILKNDLISVETDLSNDSFGKKVRNAITSKTPNIWILGGDEVEERSITWRRYCKKEQVKVPVDDAIAAIRKMVDDKLQDNEESVDLPLNESLTSNES